MENCTLRYKPGDRVESFRLLGECGRGSCGMVFLAENVVTGSRHALKIIPEGGGFSERELDAIVRYMRLCPQSDLMQITHAGRVEGGFYYVMDAADDLNGGRGDYLPDTLENRLKRDGRLSPVAALEMAGQVEKRLCFLHDRGVLHRDIKPANILYIRGEAVPGDIGLLAENSGASFAGTPGFISPEVASGARPFVPEDDFYALGKSLYCALTGNPPEKYPAFPADLSLGKCREVMKLYNRWCAGQGAFRREERPRRWRRWPYAVATLSSLIVTAASFALFRRGAIRPVPNVSESRRIVTVRQALSEAERLYAAAAPSAEFVRIRPLAEAENKRLFRERAELTTAAFARTVTPDDLDRAARDPENHSANAEDFVRLKRSGAAGEAFDREHAADPVIGYFATSQQVDAKLNTLRHLATIPQLAGTDMSAQLDDFAASLAKLKTLERRLIEKFASAP